MAAPHYETPRPRSASDTSPFRPSRSTQFIAEPSRDRPARRSSSGPPQEKEIKRPSLEPCAPVFGNLLGSPGLSVGRPMPMGCL